MDLPGTARTSTARQEPAGRLEALHRAGCQKVFQEQISTGIKVRPELEKALAQAARVQRRSHAMLGSPACRPSPSPGGDKQAVQ
ncbi:recombinase family protein [Streptomyces sp. NRRL B-3229]|uniref:recombinase family protein n=1 Tax=Streptomyces sp. NRRL B-3229 TaxID=1463836 RepID=UPI000D1431CC